MYSPGSSPSVASLLNSCSSLLLLLKTPQLLIDFTFRINLTFSKEEMFVVPRKVYSDGWLTEKSNLLSLERFPELLCAWSSNQNRDIKSRWMSVADIVPFGCKSRPLWWNSESYTSSAISAAAPQWTVIVFFSRLAFFSPRELKTHRRRLFLERTFALCNPAHVAWGSFPYFFTEPQLDKIYVWKACVYGECEGIINKKRHRWTKIVNAHIETTGKQRQLR